MTLEMRLFDSYTGFNEPLAIYFELNQYNAAISIRIKNLV